ncbi:HepT-like ribonuclease domain-containing protein [Synechococcus sp. UW140]|uniref:HepT-like ribonuclease domain-containing protein n=1 Tax=Synechococcus sp. UW140 TaxID=368503 RepID=UPI0031378019
MRRDIKAFLIDVVEATDAILEAVNGIKLDDYCNSRLIRSSVEREFIISFRNKLTHEYVKVDNTLVWGVIQSYLQPLRSACVALAAESDPGAD